MAFSWALCLVIAFNLSSSLVHSHDHSATESTCNENDACHQFIFHHQKSENCNGSHKHIQEKQDECYSCKYLKQGYYHYSQIVSINKIGFALIKKLNQNQLNFLVTNLTHFYLRGPPNV